MFSWLNWKRGKGKMSYKLDTRKMMDKRRPHLVDLYYETGKGEWLRVATYSGKTKTITFYPFELKERTPFIIQDIMLISEDIIKKQKANE